MIRSFLYPRRWRASVFSRSFRSKAALEILQGASEEKIPNLALYNYPSFSGAFAALFAKLYHSRLNLPFLVLPFSSVEPLRVSDLRMDVLETCYLLDFVGPKGFAVELSQITQQVVAFDHRKSTFQKFSQIEYCPENLILHIDVEKSSAVAAYEYFMKKLEEKMAQDKMLSVTAMCTSGLQFSLLVGICCALGVTLSNWKQGEIAGLVNHEDESRVEMVLKYIEDGDLRCWALPDAKAFTIGLNMGRSKLNCITNPYIFEELLQFCSSDLIAKAKSFHASRSDAAKKLLGKAFKIRLGRGFYGECLGVRADGHSDLTNEIGEELSRRSAAVGLRYDSPLTVKGAVVYMQRGNLKMCLRSTDSATDTAEISKMYGGGGTRASSSFIIRMDEYNEWLPNDFSLPLFPRGFNLANAAKSLLDKIGLRALLLWHIPCKEESGVVFFKPQGSGNFNQTLDVDLLSAA
ncbi:hypothetical protein ACLOJK_036181 [Asimina triloba]